MSEEDDDLVDSYITEAKENIALTEQALETLQVDNVDDNTINKIFRSVHTIKGGSGFFGLTMVGELAHSMEDVLMKLREHTLDLNKSIIESLFKGLDVLRDMLDQDDYGNSMDVKELVNVFHNLSEGKTIEATVVSEFSIISDNIWDEVNDSDDIYQLNIDIERLRKCIPLGEDLVEHFNQIGQILYSDTDLNSLIEVENGHFMMAYKSVMDMDMLSHAYNQKITDIQQLHRPSGEALLQEKLSDEPEKQAHKETSLPVQQQESVTITPAEVKTETIVENTLDKTKSPTKNTKKTDKKSSETIRVSVELLDKLMDLTGELVLGRNQLMQQLKGLSDKTHLNNIGHMISDLQQIAMQTRMQAIGLTFSKFGRIVRDLAKKVGKEIKLTISGEETELDRSIIEALSDPLTHLIRNCADHALETAIERTASGKPPIGNIFLNAYQEGGQVIIEVEDDGRGVNIEKVKNKAISAGIITSDEGDQMSTQEIANLIFRAGFSTADAVSDISGRGVGMDVVKSSFEAVGGVVSLETFPGKGSIIKVRLPLTMAILSSLIVYIEDKRFAVPQIDIRELVRIRSEDKIQIEKIQGQDIYRLRGQLIPIISLHQLLNFKKTYVDEEEKEKKIDRRQKISDRRSENEVSESIEQMRTGSDRRVNPNEHLFLVLRSGSHLVGVLIDEISHTEEIVVKPLAEILKRCIAYSGSAILGDGDVAMVLNTNGLCEKAKLKFQASDSQNSVHGNLESQQLEDLQEKQNFLIFNYANDEQFALPLSLVFKVEQVEVSRIQKMANKEYVLLEGRNVMIIRLDQYLEVSPVENTEGTIFLIIPKVANFNGAIMATAIKDSLEMRLAIDELPIPQEGILGMTTINEQLTYILDLYSLFEKISPQRSIKHKDGIKEKTRLLYAEDTPFFRKLVQIYFESLGFKVTTANNGKDALSILNEQPEAFDIILSDLQMPVMDGFELVKNIKSISKLKHIPTLALTGHTDEKTKNQALEAGFDGFGVKTNKDDIIHLVKKFVRDA